MRTIEEVVKEISDNAQYRNGDPTYLFEGYDVEKTLREILEIHKNERPTGKWWIDWVDTGFSYHIRCSLCNKAVIEQDNYCPNCGAKMERCEDETDD